MEFREHFNSLPVYSFFQILNPLQVLLKTVIESPNLDYLVAYAVVCCLAIVDYTFLKHI